MHAAAAVLVLVLVQAQRKKHFGIQKLAACGLTGAVYGLTNVVAPPQVNIVSPKAILTPSVGRRPLILATLPTQGLSEPGKFVAVVFVMGSKKYVAVTEYNKKLRSSLVMLQG